MKTLADIKEDLLHARRVCPQPSRWNELWQLLPDRRQVGAAWQPALPLILAAWDNSSDAEKQNRFLQHLQWAADHDALDVAVAFLTKLKPEDWHIES